MTTDKNSSLSHAKIVRVSDLHPIDQLLIQHFFGADTKAVAMKVASGPASDESELSHAKVDD